MNHCRAFWITLIRKGLADYADDVYPQITQMTQIVDAERAGMGDPQTYAIIGAAMEVHRILGPGFLEGVYQAALEIELSRKGISWVREVELPVVYRGTTLRVRYRADFVCFDCVLVEVKALRTLTPVEESQVLNYLKASGIRRGLLLNFGGRSLEYRRFLAPFPSTFGQSA